MSTRATLLEPATVYFPVGTKERLKAAATAVGLTPSSFIRMSVLERLKLAEADQQPDDQQVAD